ncbi:hypothetical protein LIER_16912 [Lithospermum erythrorhizon]|uniref:Uncharacterized protein n=1 Tax=Lithospermum erythrorhizon TaxID=34254 RepID=A0AAV3QDT4_LITER
MFSPAKDQPNPKTTIEEPKLDSSSTHVNSPPQSFWVPKDDENDWLEQNSIMQRKTSRKLVFFPTQNDYHQTKPGFLGSVFSSTQKLKTSLIGFPAGPTSSFHNEKHRQNKTGNIFLFRSRSESRRKSGSQENEIEPGSPQVNCVGGIGTRRERAKKTGFTSICCNEMSTDVRTGPVDSVIHAPSLAGLKAKGSVH